MFPRIRDITDPFGSILRVIVEPQPSGALVVIERPAAGSSGHAMLDIYGSEILAGFIMCARLTTPNVMPDEEIGGDFPTRFQLSTERGTCVIIDQLSSETPFRIPAAFWERLYAELCIVNAHARELGRRQSARSH